MIPLNNHKLKIIQAIIDSYDDIKDLTEEGGKTKIAFVKKLDKGYAVVVELSKENDKIMLHKTFFYKDASGKRIPFKNKPSILEKWSADGSTTISPVANGQPADTENISALDHASDGKDNAISENVKGNDKNNLSTTLIPLNNHKLKIQVHRLAPPMQVYRHQHPED